MKKKFGLIISIFILIMSIIISSVFFLDNFFRHKKISSSEYSSKLSEYNKKISTVNNEMHNEFINNGITEKYYNLQDEYSQLLKEKNNFVLDNKRDNTSIVFKLFPSIFILIFGCTFATIIYKFTNFNGFEMINNINLNIKSNEDNIEKEYVSYKCPNCGNTNLKGNNEEKCDYCGSFLKKVKKY